MGNKTIMSALKLLFKIIPEALYSAPKVKQKKGIQNRKDGIKLSLTT